jgi:hypothetical protein
LNKNYSVLVQKYKTEIKRLQSHCAICFRTEVNRENSQHFELDSHSAEDCVDNNTEIGLVKYKDSVGNCPVNRIKTSADAASEDSRPSKDGPYRRGRHTNPLKVISEDVTPAAVELAVNSQQDTIRQSFNRHGPPDFSAEGNGLEDVEPCLFTARNSSQDRSANRRKTSAKSASEDNLLSKDGRHRIDCEKRPKTILSEDAPKAAVELPVGLQQHTVSQNNVCIYYIKGFCRFGARCSNLHAPPVDLCNQPRPPPFTPFCQPFAPRFSYGGSMPFFPYRRY